jgi:hypothetical protein
MPPKKRGRPTKKEAEVLKPAVSDEEVSAPPTKRTRGNGKVEVQISSDDDAPAAPLKKTRATKGSSKPATQKSVPAERNAKVKDEAAAEDADDDALAAEISSVKVPSNSRSAAKKNRGKREAVAVDDIGENTTTTEASTIAKIPAKKGKGKAQIGAEDVEVKGDVIDAMNLVLDGTQSAQDDKKDSLFQKPIKKPQNDAQIIRTKNLAVPVDESCPYGGE